MADYVTLFGENLVSKEGLVPTTELKGKVVGLYFSAHWCPPCRMFTPKLRQVYLGLKNQGKNFEVIFCSCDQGPREFEEYFASMPWKAIPFERDDIREKLSRQFNISGIPTLLLIDEESGLYSTDGRSYVVGNPSGFPWK